MREDDGVMKCAMCLVSTCIREMQSRGIRFGLNVDEVMHAITFVAMISSDLS